LAQVCVISVFALLKIENQNHFEQKSRKKLKLFRLSECQLSDRRPFSYEILSAIRLFQSCELITISSTKKSITYIMKLFLILSLFCLISLTSTQAQTTFPENPEDVSPLLVGERLPNAPLFTPNGVKTSLHAVLKEKPTVLIFFRGGWCPYCNAQLVDLRKSLPSIVELGYQLVAISPDSFEKTGENLSKNNLNFTLLSDLTREAMIGAGIAYQAPENYKSVITKNSNGKNTDLLPVPSVFVVDKKGNIHFEYVNPDFKTRISNELLLAALKGLSLK
jgi:peroxiredoxin